MVINLEKYDVTALGEILIDFTFYGKSENGMRLFEQNPGGAPANVLAAVSRLGGRTAMIGKVGLDMHGNFLRETLSLANIETSGLLDEADAFTTLAFVSLDENGDRSFSFARKPGADTCIKPDEINTDIIADSNIFHIGSLSLTDEPSKSATLSAIEFAKSKGVTVSYDPNYRASLWKSEKCARAEMTSVLKYADIIKLSDEELPLLTDCQCEKEASLKLLDMGISIVIVTLGERGAFLRTREGFAYCDSIDVPVVDTTGAGDAFMGGFLYKLSQSTQKPSAVRLNQITEFAEFSTAVAAHCITRRGAINAMPTQEEIAALLKAPRK